jgi:NTE family protein
LGIGDFNQLPIPFRAMATDIETGDAVVLGHGSVAQAMRASMSVPGAIMPAEIDGRLLVDGGIANNLPIDEARKLCGDVIIAVNISTPPLRRDQITSALSVTAQLINFLGKQTVDEQLRSLGPNDVLIEPDLGTISSSSFDRTRDAIRIGEEATRALAGQLSRYSISPEQYAVLRDRQAAEGKALGKVDEIRVEGLKRTNPAVAEALIESEPGEPLSEAKLGADLRRIFGTGDFETLSYCIVGGETGPRALVIEPVEKSWGPNYLRFGLGVASDFSVDSQFNALVQYRRTWMNRLGAEWTTQVQVGQNTHLSTEFFQPLNEAGKWFVAPSYYIGEQTRGVFENEDKIADYLTSVSQGGVDAGAVLGTWGQVRAGYSMSRVHARVETGSTLLPSVRETTAGLRVGVFIDQTDAAWFARSGWGMTGTGYFAMDSLGSEVSYNRVEASARAVHSWGSHTLNLSGSGGSSLGSDAPAYESFSLGGPLHLLAYRLNEFAGRQFVFGRLMYYNRTVPLPDILGTGIYVGGSVEVGRISDRTGGLSTPGTVWSSSVFLGADTFIGPAYFGVGVGAGRWSLYLLIGVP